MVLGHFLAELQSRLVLHVKIAPRLVLAEHVSSGNLGSTKGLIHRYHSTVLYRVVSHVGPYQML
jgi:hypothetical protein